MSVTLPPKPEPPIAPDDDACCGSGCTPCIWDFYYEELERYRAELAQWQLLQAQQAKLD